MKSKDREIEQLFTKASTLTEQDLVELTPAEIEHRKYVNGVTNFKKKVLGVWGSKRILTLGEITELLIKTNIIPSAGESQKLLDFLDGEKVSYTGKSPDYLFFNRVNGKNNTPMYRITQGSYD